MENLVSESFFSHGFCALAFSMVVNILCAVFRKVVESIKPSVKVAGSWRELWLPIMPIVFGAVLAMSLASFPYPEAFGATVAMRAVYGVLVGFFSTWAYRIVKTIVQRKWDVQLPDLEIRHPSFPPEDPDTKPEDTKPEDTEDPKA